MDKKIFIIIINVSLSVALFLIFIHPLWFSVLDLNSRLTNAQNELEKTKEVISETERLALEYSSMGQDAEKFLMALPEEADVPHVLVQLEGMALNNGLLLKGLELGTTKGNGQTSASTVKSKGSFKLLEVNAQLGGSYASFKSFLNAIEDSLRPIDVYSMSFTVYKKDNQDVDLINTFDFQVAMGIYYTN